MQQLIGRDIKGKLSAVLYAIAIVLAYLNTFVAQAIYASVACMWLIPDRRIESKLDE